MFPLDTRILVVDDMSTMRKLIIKCFKGLGFQNIIEAEDGAKAWETMVGANPPFQLVVSDWNMPGSTGIDLLRRVRADSRYKDIPFILITAESENSQVSEAVTAGVSNYIIKPFTAETLAAKLEAVYKKVSG